MLNTCKRVNLYAAMHMYACQTSERGKQRRDVKPTPLSSPQSSPYYGTQVGTATVDVSSRGEVGCGNLDGEKSNLPHARLTSPTVAQPRIIRILR
jgi:hypothetical protein